MKRRTIDLVVSAAALVIGVILLVLGFVLTSNANFAKNYVHDQLAQEQISFPTSDVIAADPATAAKPCLVQYAGQELLTGKQAECYANSFIGLHLSKMGAGTPYAGHSYAALGDDANAIKAQITAAGSDTAKVADLNKTLTAVNAQRDTVFKGEMLRGVLLTSYGFSELGAKAALGATVAYAGAGVMALLGLLGLWHGAPTPASRAFAPVEPAEARREKAVANA
jgi:hypothetical protein